MSRNRRSFSQQNYQKDTSLIETSINLTQKDIDQYTRKLEFERKRAYGTQQTLDELKKDIENRKTRIRQLKLITEKSVNRKTSAVLQNLRKSCENNKKQYNSLLDEINLVKIQINKLRRERASFMEEYVQAEQELESYSKEVETLNKINEARREEDVDRQIKLLELKEAKNQELSNYESQFNTMKETFLKKKLILDKEQTHNKLFKEDDNMYENHDTLSVLKNRLKKIIFRNKNKVRILDDYMRNLTIIDDGFNQIKEQTGMTDIVEIQNTFIKSEEQNHQLLTYSDLLNQQIDNLEDVTRDIERKIYDQEKENSIRQQILNGVPDEDKLKAKISAILQSKQVPIIQFQKLLDEIFPYLEQMLLGLAESKFNTQFPYKLFEYQNGILLNEGTVDLYLSDLETYIMELLKYIAKKNGLSNAYTSALLIEGIPEKDFSAKKQTEQQPNIPITNIQETDENNPSFLNDNQLYNYQSFKDHAIKTLDKKKQYQSVPNTVDSSPQQRNLDFVSGPNKVLRGNYMK
ncbi:hypothetical protein ABPG72_000216 [Tetrahymena utriculariae]